MNEKNVSSVVAILPFATIAVIVFLIVRTRVVSGSRRPNARRWTFPRPKPRKPAVLLPFDRTKMDDELSRLLRKKP